MDHTDQHIFKLFKKIANSVTIDPLKVLIKEWLHALYSYCLVNLFLVLICVILQHMDGEEPLIHPLIPSTNLILTSLWVQMVGERH